MSVPTWQRSLSNAEFLYQIFELNILIGKIMENKPKKYKSSYSDFVIQTALEALKEARIANDEPFAREAITERAYLFRREHFQTAMSLIKTVSTVSHIFLEIVRESNQYESTKLYKQETQIGDKCGECIALLKGVINSDKERYKSSIRSEDF